MTTSDVAHPLLVDLYELTMAAAYHRAGMAELPATFSLFIRHLPSDRGYLVAAGLDDTLDWLEQLRFGPAELAALERLEMFDDDALEWLGNLRFTGSVRAVPEGRLVFADEPILEVDAPLAQAQLAETFLLNQVTTQTTLATKAARLRHAAGGRPVVDFALRRAQGVDAGMKLVRAARIAGLAGTSNVAGADRYGLDARGTMAHSFVQAFEDETAAFAAFADTFDGATLLVDTYDTPRGVDRAIEVALAEQRRGRSVGAVRLDSGDLGELAVDARRRLDAAGLDGVRIVASGGLDELQIAELVAGGAPIDGFGVGSSLAVSADAPVMDSVYKLVAAGDRAVRKTSEGKATWPGAKQVWRNGERAEDHLGLADQDPPPGEALLVEVMANGQRTPDGAVDLAAAHQRFAADLERLPERYRRLREPAEYPVHPTPELEELAQRLDSILRHA